VVGGLLATLIVKRVWRLVAGEEDTPDATDEHRSWGEVLAAAALEGAIFAVVRAAVDRGGATGIRHLTGEWPT
jgi:predicted metal-dependent enzyme (double-stranded beta helix superfamily)